MSDSVSRSNAAKFGQAMTMGDSFPVNNQAGPWSKKLPYVHAGLLAHEKPPHTDELRVRANYQTTGLDKAFGEMPKMDPQKWAEFTEHIEAQKEDFIKTAVASAAVDWTSHTGKAKLQKLRPELLQRHLKALQTYKYIIEQLWKMLQRRTIETNEDVDFLLMAFNPNFVIPVGPAYDPFLLYLDWPKLGLAAQDQRYAGQGVIPAPMTNNKSVFARYPRLQVLKNKLYHEGNSQSTFSFLAKLFIAEKILPMNAAGTKLKIAEDLALTNEQWLFRIQYHDPLDKSKKHKIGRKYRKDGQAVEDTYFRGIIPGDV